MAIVILPQRGEPECMVDHSKTGLMRDNTHSVYEHIGPAQELNRYARTHQKKIQPEQTGLMPMGCLRIYGNFVERIDFRSIADCYPVMRLRHYTVLVRPPRRVKTEPHGNGFCA